MRSPIFGVVFSGVETGIFVNAGWVFSGPTKFEVLMLCCAFPPYLGSKPLSFIPLQDSIRGSLRSLSNPCQQWREDSSKSDNQPIRIEASGC